MSESTRIDCDIHNESPALETLYPYLPDRWLDYCRESAFNGPDAADYPDSVPTAAREDSSPKPDLTEVQDRALKDVEIGILNCAYRVQSVRNEDLAASLAAAVNQWQVEHWLEEEPRISVRACADGDFLDIEVSDNGIGTAERDTRMLFAAGYTTKGDGTGLGLHSAANFVISSGGQIRLLSDGIGKGATAHVRLRLPGQG